MVCLICCISNTESEKIRKRKIDRMSIGFPQDFRHVNHVGTGDTSNYTSFSTLSQQIRDMNCDQVNAPISQILINCIDLQQPQSSNNDHNRIRYSVNWTSLSDLPPPPDPPCITNEESN